MPKRTDADMAARRSSILRAARRCFARKGFQATTIADLSAESGISAGGIYTHFANKHALTAAIGQESAQSPADQSGGLLALYDALRDTPGEEDARLDLNLWAEALRDEVLHTQVTDAMDAFSAQLKRLLPKGRTANHWVAAFEALALGLEVQRALGRPQPPRLRSALEALLSGAA